MTWHNRPSFWGLYPEALQYVTDSWQNLSGREIALILSNAYGVRVTRNVVIGKISRLHLLKKSSETTAPAVTLAAPKAARLTIQPTPTRKSPPVPIKPIPTPSSSLNLTIVDLEDGMCRWPFNYDDDRMMRYCGVKTRDQQTVYCDHHTRLSTTPSHKTRRR